MSSLNKVLLIGRLGRDPEVRYLENGVAVAKFSLATSESYKDKDGNWQEQTEWHDIVLWRFLAERAEKQLTKGRLIYVEGKLTHRKWQDQDGNNRRTTEVVAQSFKTLDKRDDSDGGYFPRAEDEAPTTNRKEAPPAVSEPMPTEKQEAVLDDPADDLPF